MNYGYYRNILETYGLVYTWKGGDDFIWASLTSSATAAGIDYSISADTHKKAIMKLYKKIYNLMLEHT